MTILTRYVDKYVEFIRIYIMSSMGEQLVNNYVLLDIYKGLNIT